MNKLIFFISHFEVLNFETVLSRLCSELHLSADRECSRVMLMEDDRGSFSIEEKIKLESSDGQTAEMQIRNSDRREYEFYDKKYCVELHYEEEAREIATSAAGFMKEAFTSYMPSSFISMEHLLSYFREYTEITLTTVQDNLIVAAQSALEELLKTFSNLGRVTFKKRFDRNPERQRIEYRENVYRYVEINTYQVFEKNGFIVAAGITRPVDKFSDSERYLVTAFVKQNDMNRAEEIFDKQYEELLLNNIDVKGGKFTGDHKIIKLSEKLTLDDIILEEKVQEKLQKEVFDFFKYKHLYKKAGIPFKRGVALYGPPGSGKTMVAKILASTMSETVIWVKAGDISTVEDISRVFRLARMGRPSIIVLEDIDFYTEDRDRAHSNKIGIATLMSNLDGLEENDGILVIVTTNRLENIERAIVDRPGRIDTRIYMGELGRDSISQLLEKKLGKMNRDFDSFLKLIPAGTIMTGAMAVELASLIIRYAIKDAGDTDGEIIITADSVQKALKDIIRAENRKAGF